MTVVYQSRFLRFWRVQVHRWQHHWQMQHRRWQTSLKWTVQAWVYPLYRLVQLNQWLPRGLKQGLKQQWQALQAQAEPPPPPASDTPIVNLLQSLDSPGLTLTHADGATAPQLILHPPQPPSKPIFQPDWTRLTALGIMGWKSLKVWWTPKQPQQLPVIPAPLALEPAHSTEPSPDRPQSKLMTPIQAWWQWLGAKFQSQRPELPIPQSNLKTSAALESLTAPLDLTPTAKSGTITPPASHLAWGWLKTTTLQLAQTTQTFWQKRDQISDSFQALTRTIKTALQPRDSAALEKLARPSTAGLEPQTIQIQGIACQLTNRHLVLVGANNQIFDILTGAQQKQLTERILWELAGYYYQLRQWQHLTGQSLDQWGLAPGAKASLDPDPHPPRPDGSLFPQLNSSPLGLHRLWEQFQAWLLGWPTPPPEAQSLIIPATPVRAIGQNPTQLISPLSGLHIPHLANPNQSLGLTATHPFTLDIDSTFLGYEPQGLEIIWLWLDRLFLWLERAWAWLWGLGLKLGNFETHP